MSIFKIEIMCLILKNSTSRIHAKVTFGMDAYKHHTQLDLCSRLATQCKAIDKLHDLCPMYTAEGVQCRHLYFSL